jgi:hypothetical protein
LSWEVYEFGKSINAVNLRINEDIGGLMRWVMGVVNCEYNLFKNSQFKYFENYIFRI